MAVTVPGLTTALKSKAAVGALAAVLVLGAGTGTAAAAANGAFGQQVKEQVQDCKQAMATNGVHGIGECVSDFAQQHGKQQHGKRQGQQHQSHSANGGFGQQVKEQVQDCKQGAATNGAHGIGECVSDFAQQHGRQRGHQH